MNQLDLCLPLKPKDRHPFHWSNRTQPRHVKFFVFGTAEATTPFTIADCGSLAVTNKLHDGRIYYFRVTKRVVLNSTFIIIEDMVNAPYKIDNLSEVVSVSFFQVGCKKIEEIEDCEPNSCRPFAWRSVVNSTFLLNVQFYVRDGSSTEVLVPKKVQDRRRPTNIEYSLDILNRTEKVGLVDSNFNEYTVYISAYTDQNQKVFEISDEPSKNIFETEKDKKKREGIEENDKFLDVTLNSSVDLSRLEEEKEEDVVEHVIEDEESRTQIELRQVNISLIKVGSELLTLVLDRCSAVVSTTKQEFIYEATLGRLQIDNHGQIDPLFPVILRPKCTAQDEEHDHFKMINVQPVMQQYVSIKTNIPNMQYINWFEFLVKELELRIELSHLMSIVEWFMAFNEKQGVGLASSHEIFKDQCLTGDEMTTDHLRDSFSPLNASERNMNSKTRKVVTWSNSVLEERKEPTNLDEFLQ